jgi:hypothetical protein
MVSAGTDSFCLGIRRTDRAVPLSAKSILQLSRHPLTWRVAPPLEGCPIASKLRSRSLCQVSFQDSLVRGIAPRSSTFDPTPPRQERRSYAAPAGSGEPRDVDRGRRRGSVRSGPVGFGASRCLSRRLGRTVVLPAPPADTTTRFGRISSRTGQAASQPPFAASRIPPPSHIRAHPATSRNPLCSAWLHPVPRRRVVGCGRRHAERQRRRPRLEHPARTIHYDSNTRPNQSPRLQTPAPLLGPAHCPASVQHERITS